MNDKCKICQVSDVYHVSFVARQTRSLFEIYYYMKVHSSSCEIEYFVETHMCKLSCM